MAFVSLTEFTARQILTAAQLNAIIAALQGFSAQTADLAWPLVLGGDIDADNQYTIDNMQELWGIYNAGEYADLDTAMTAINSAGGGCLLIPPNTTIDGKTGTTITASNVLVLGCGMSSKIDLSSGAGPLFDTNGSLSNVAFQNLQITDTAGASGTGVKFQRTTGAKLIDVLFTGVDGDSVYFTNDGTAGNACADAMMRGVTFVGGGANGNHIKADDLDGLQMDEVLSKTAGGDAIAMEPSAANSLIRDINIGATVRVESPTGKGISILSGSATADAKWSRITLCGPTVVAPTDDGFEIGEASKILQDIDMQGCTVVTPGADAFVVNAQRGLVSNCKGRAAVGDGLDLVASEDVLVTGCHLQDAGALGIDASDLPASSDCVIMGNNVKDATTEGIAKPESVDSGLECGNNIGDKAKLMGGTLTKVSGVANAGAGQEDVWTYTIPANTLTKEGDGLRAFAVGVTSGTPGTGTMRVALGSDAIGLAVTTADTDLWIHCYCFINDQGPDAASNTNYAYGSSHGDDADNVGGGVRTVDWTEDVVFTITIQATNGASRIQCRSAMFTMYEGEAG